MHRFLHNARKKRNREGRREILSGSANETSQRVTRSEHEGKEVVASGT